jgi:hypothetical protein
MNHTFILNTPSKAPDLYIGDLVENTNALRDDIGPFLINLVNQKKARLRTDLNHFYFPAMRETFLYTARSTSVINLGSSSVVYYLSEEDLENDHLQWLLKVSGKSVSDLLTERRTNTTEYSLERLYSSNPGAQYGLYYILRKFYNFSNFYNEEPGQINFPQRGLKVLSTLFPSLNFQRISITNYYGVYKFLSALFALISPRGIYYLSEGNFLEGKREMSNSLLLFSKTRGISKLGYDFSKLEYDSFPNSQRAVVTLAQKLKIPVYNLYYPVDRKHIIRNVFYC